MTDAGKAYSNRANIDQLRADLQQAHARIEQLEEALREIAEHGERDGETTKNCDELCVFDLKDIARQALSEPNEEETP